MQDVRSRIRCHPIYLMLDVSHSMQRRTAAGHSPLGIFARLLDRLVFELAGVPRINTTVWMSMLAFSDGVQVVRAMAPVLPPDAPDPIRRGRETNYTAALRFLVDRVPRDERRIQKATEVHGNEARVSRPIVFLITDGAPYAGRRDQPDGEWLSERNRLVAPPVGARIAAIGLRGEREHTLWQLATGRDEERNAFIARPDASPEGLAASIKKAITDSITHSVRAGEMVMGVPNGMRRARIRRDGSHGDG